LGSKFNPPPPPFVRVYLITTILSEYGAEEKAWWSMCSEVEPDTALRKRVLIIMIIIIESGT